MYWNKEMEMITNWKKQEIMKKEVKEVLGFDLSWEELKESLEFEEEVFIRNWSIKIFWKTFIKSPVFVEGKVEKQM